MLLVPIVPHSNSGEEDEILNLICPSETDLIPGSVSEEEYNHVAEEVRFISDEDYYDHRSEHCDSGTRSGVDSDMLCDAFFADVREREERIEMERATTMLRVIEEERTETSDQELKYTTRNMNPAVSLSEQPEHIYLKTNSQQCAGNRQFKSFDEGISHAFRTGRQVPVCTIQHSHSNESSESIFSSSTNRSGASYSSASIMRLKARKRMLEKHHSRTSILKGTVSLDQVDVSRKAHRAVVAAV